MTNNKAKLVFEYTNEFGSTKVEKLFDENLIVENEPDGVYGYLIDQFYIFLKQAEFHCDSTSDDKNK